MPQLFCPRSFSTRLFQTWNSRKAKPEARVLEACLESQGTRTGELEANALITLVGRLHGGKPVKVHVITSSPCGKNEVSIDIEEAATKSEVKKMLVNATGIPYEYQKVVLSGIGQLAVADKRLAGIIEVRKM